MRPLSSRSLLFAAGVAVALIVGLAAVPAPIPPQNVAPAFDVTISVHPSSQDQYQLLKRKTPDTFTCTATILDPAPRAEPIGYGHVELVVSRGTRQSVTKEFGEYKVEFSAKVSASSDRAESVVTISRAGNVLNRQRSQMWLRPPAKIEPAQ